MPRPVPADLEDALAASPDARDRFWALSPEQKDGWVAYVERGRLPGARRRRAHEVVSRFGGTAPAGAVPRETWALWLVGLALLLGLAAFLLWLTVFRGNGDSEPGAVVVAATSTVPKVTGIRYQAAEFQLKEAKLSSTLTRRNSSKPKGIVLAQTPKRGKEVPQGTRVALVVSKGPPGVKLPDLVGLAAADAVKALQARKLRVRIEQTASSEAPGTVVAQTPKAGARAKRTTAVVLEVAKGREAAATTTAQTTTTAPPATTTTATTTTATTTTTTSTTTSGVQPPARGNDYTGMRLDDAVQKIAQGRQQVIVEYVASSEPAGVVVANSRAGSRERLRVSAGARPKQSRQVPDVLDEDASSAEDDLRAAGFSVVEVSWPVSDSSKDGVVVYETPAAGAPVPQGAAIVVYVGSATG